MEISTSTFVNPPGNQLYATFAVAVSVVVFAYSSRLGSLSILIYYGIWMPLVLVDTRLLLRRPADFLWPVGFAAVAVASPIWSPAPDLSLRGALQFLTQVLCAIIAARVVDISALTRGMIFGTFAVIIYSLFFGTFAYDILDESYTFVGAFGSKNQLALFCSLGIYFCAVLVLTLRQSKTTSAIALAFGAVFVGTLVSSRSATSTVSIVVALFALAFLLALLRFSPVARNAILAMLVPCFAISVVAALHLGAMDALLGAFGKDSTLTGRTYLWSEGIAAGDLRPFLGAGYQAYWVQGFSEAERLWKEFYIENRSGFHFHNTYIEVYVELGFLGLFTYVMVLLSTLVRLSVRVATRRDSEAAVLVGLSVLLLVRSFFEVDSLYPYTVGSFLLMFLCVFVHRRPGKRFATPYAKSFGVPIHALALGSTGTFRRAGNRLLPNASTARDGADRILSAPTRDQASF